MLKPNELEKELVKELGKMFKKFPIEKDGYVDFSKFDLNSKIRFLIDSYLLKLGKKTPSRSYLLGKKNLKGK